MKKLILLFAIINVTLLNAQSAQFAWMAGTTFTNQTGVYGTLGIPSATNIPGSRILSASWKDNSGDFWVFGGSGYGTTASVGNLNDLWRYTPSSNEWVWVAGPNVTSQLGVYGTKGVTSASNTPGARNGSATWVDNAGNFWMFGGNGFASVAGSGNLNDLWKFNPVTLEWTWISGSNLVNQNGSWGTKGVPSATNTPSARAQAASWVDSNGDLWLFGGDGKGAPGFDGLLYDLWKYNIASNQWTWVSGGNGINSIGVYGTQGTPAAANAPGSRYGASTWTDNTGNLWLYGGTGLATVMITGSLPDLWKYNVATNQWTWVKGASSTNTNGIYGVMGSPASTNAPGARFWATTWLDNANNLWMFGGNGNAASSSGTLSDLWQYNTSTNLWVWVSGSNAPLQSAVYGTQGVASLTNTPGSRMNMSSWKDNNGDFWLFDGRSNTSPYKTDLWKISICNGPAAPVNTTSVQAICRNESIALSATGTGSLSWYTAAVGGSFLGNGNSYTTPTLTTTTTYYVQDSTCARSIRTAVTVTVNPLPAVAIAGSNTICSASNYTLTASGASTYTWNTGATTASLTGNQQTTTTFSVVGTSTAGCINSAVKTLSVYASPTLAISGNTLVCRGMGTTLTISGADSYTWTPFNQTATQPFSNVTTTSTYTYAGANTLGGCRMTGAVTVSMVPNPTITIAGSSTVCLGSSVNLSANGATNYTWSTGAQTASIAPTPTANTTYSVYGTNFNGCSATKSITVNTYSVPVLSISGVGAVCEGATATIGVSGAITYTWSTGSTNTSISVTPSVTTTYSVIGQGNYWCTSTTVKTITVNPKPTVAITGNTAICQGSGATLIASGADTYTWSNSIVNTQITVTPTTSTTYTVTGVDVNNCSNTAIQTVSVITLPVISVVPTTTLLCAGQTTSLSASGASSYTWSTGDNTAQIAVSPTVNTTYTVTGTDNGCDNSAVFTQSVSLCTGIETLKANDVFLQVYPNPNNGGCTVKSMKEDVIVLYNEIGETVGVYELNSRNNYTQQFSDLPSGIYFLSGKVSRFKIVVTR